MAWITRHFTLPILLGVSLSSISIAVLYVLYKKDEDDIKTRKSDIEIAKRIIRKCKVPRQFVPAVIGRGGSVVKDVQNKTGTQITFEEDNIECQERICIIRGNHESVQLAEEMIKTIIENQPIIETYETYVPQKACGRIIGRGGETIQQIQSTSSAKVLIDSAPTSYDLNAQRRIIIKGTAEQIASALSQIEDKVREEVEARMKIEASSATRLPRTKLSPRNAAVATPDQVQTTDSLSVQVSDGLMEVYVSAMENPSQFWVQVVGSGITALDKLVSEMTAYYNDEENHESHVLRNVSIGQVVAAKFNFDDQWYRAEVTSITEDGECEVYFVDYGNRDMVQLDAVLELRTDFLSLRLQAIECSLANVKPRENEWSTEACERFSELTWLAQWKVLIAKVKGYKERVLSCGRSRREGSPIPCVELFDKNDEKEINVGQELINEDFAEPEETVSSTASSTLSLTTRNPETASISSPAPASPPANRRPSPEFSADTPGKLERTTDSSSVSIVEPETPRNARARVPVEEINLVTPRKPGGKIEEVDLVTPVKDETSRFIRNEKKELDDGSSGDHARNGSDSKHGKFQNPQLKIEKSARIAPAGYESDLSNDSDELELG